MSIDPKDAIADIDRVLAHRPAERAENGGRAEVMAMMAQCIDRWAPRDSAYQERKDKALKKGDDNNNPEFMRGTLHALRADYVAGVAPKTFEQLVHAGVFADLLKQAEHLLDDGGYLLPAAVIGGAALEEHLRLLAARHGMAVTNADGGPLKASQVNNDLGKGKVYGELERAQVEALLKLRNSAAHNTPEFKSVTEAQVRNMLSGVRDFMLRHPA